MWSGCVIGKSVRDSAPCNHSRSAPAQFVLLLAVGTGNCEAMTFVPDGWAPSLYNMLLEAIATDCESYRSVKGNYGKGSDGRIGGSAAPDGAGNFWHAAVAPVN